MKERLESIKQEAIKQIQASDVPEKLNDVRVKFLGKKGELTAVLKGMKDVAPEERPKVGQLVNETRAAIEELLDETKKKMDAAIREEKLKQDTHVDAPANGGMVKMNMTVNYNFIPDRVTELYERFNGMDGDDLVESKVKNSIIAYIKEVTPKFSVMDIYSDKRSEVGQAITEYLNSKLNDEYGIEISSALIIDVQLDEALQEKVKAKEQAKQDAEKAELDKQTAIAQGEAKKAEAEANAQVTITNAKAEAAANKLKSESITDELIRMTEAEARKEHGWVTVQGADTVVADEK